jgi:hypothetical protein
MAQCDICENDIKGKQFNIGSFACKKKVLGNQSLRLCANCNDLHKKCLSKSDKTDLTRNCEAIRKKKEQAKGKRMNEKAAIKAKGKEEAAKRKLKKGVSCECPHCSKYGKLIALPKFTYQVKQGFYAYCDIEWTECVGTKGCGPCVGVIAILQSGEVFCTHLDHSMGGKDIKKCRRDKTAMAVLIDSLANVFPDKYEVKEIHVTYTTPGWISEATVAAIEKLYHPLRPLIHGEDAIYTVHGGVRSADSQGAKTGGRIVMNGEVTLGVENNIMVLLQK